MPHAAQLEQVALSFCDIPLLKKIADSMAEMQSRF